MRIAVMGSGGVGGYFGGRLAAAGEDVTFLARGPHLEAMRQKGLSIRSAMGDAVVTPTQATDDPGSIGPVDLVLFAVKLYDTESAAAALGPLLGPDTGVVTLQNGVVSTQVLERALGPRHVLGGVARIASVIAEPGTIRTTGQSAEMLFGELDGRTSERVQALAAALEAAGVTHRVSDDIRTDIWDKMVFLAAFAGLTSLMRLPFGPIRADPETRMLWHDGLAEGLAVAQAEGASLPQERVDQMMAFSDQLPAEVKSSMLQDLENGRRLEVDWLSGTIARLGEKHGVATPVHRLINAALKLHADGRR